MSSYSDLKRGGETLNSKLFRILNSAVCFILSFISVNYLSWFVSAVACKIFKCDVIVYFTGLKIITPVDADLFWNRLRVILIYGTPAVFPLLFGLFSLYIYDKTRQIKTLFNVYLLWNFFVGTMMFAAQGAIASLGVSEANSEFYRNLAVVYSWFYIPAPLAYILNVPFAILFLYFGKHAVRLFLLFAYSFVKVNKLSRRRKYFIETMVVPFVIGCIAIIALKFYSNLIYDMFMVLLYFITFGIGMLYGLYTLTETEIMKDEVLKYKSFQEASYLLPVLLIAVCAFVYLAREGIYFSFN